MGGIQVLGWDHSSNSFTRPDLKRFACFLLKKKKNSAFALYIFAIVLCGTRDPISLEMNRSALELTS